jgi:HTH-type transcriptional regulator/antitoxin HigA
MYAKPITTSADYDAALAAIEALIDRDPDRGTPAADELEVLSVLVTDYEDRNFPVGPVDPIEAIKFRMEQQGLRQVDLVPFIGTRGRVSEVLSGKRPLTLSMIRRLHKGLGIPAESLIQHGESSVTSRLEKKLLAIRICKIKDRIKRYTEALTRYPEISSIAVTLVSLRKHLLTLTQSAECDR